MSGPWEQYEEKGPWSQYTAPQTKVGEILQRRGQQGWDAVDAYNKGEQTGAETGLQILAKSGVGTIADLTGAGASELWRAGGGAAKRAVDSTLESAGDTALGRHFNKGLENIGDVYGQFSQSHPRAARNIESAGLLAGVVPVARAIPSKKFAAGEAVFNEKKNRFVMELITPKQTPTVKSDLFAQSAEQGLLNRRVVIPNEHQKKVMETVASTGVRKGNSLLKNRVIIDKSREEIGSKLLSDLQASKVIYSPTDMRARINTATAKMLEDEPLIVGDGERVAEKVAAKLNSLIQNNPGTPAGLLKARQDFDQWALSRNKGAFDGNETAFKTAVKAYRNEANQYIADMVPDAAVRDALTRQSHLFEASDAINSKGWMQGGNRVSRGVQKIDEALPGNATSRALTALGAGAATYLGVKK